jgi:hypothetical protein
MGPPARSTAHCRYRTGSALRTLRKLSAVFAIPGSRAVLAAVLAGAVTLTASGCAQFNQALGQQEEVVIFQPNTPDSVKLQVRAACSHVPGTVPEPLPTDHIVSDHVYNVRYQVGHASTVDLARLQQCLTRFPSVSGLETNTPGGN